MFNDEFRNGLNQDPWMALKQIHNEFCKFDLQNGRSLTESTARQYLIGYVFVKNFAQQHEIEFRQPHPVFDFEEPSQGLGDRNAQVIHKIRAFFNGIKEQINDNVNKLNLMQAMEMEEKKYKLSSVDKNQNLEQTANEDDLLDEKRIKILQEIFDQFMGSGEWPLLRLFEVNQAFGDVRTWIKTMPNKYVRIFNEHQKDERVILGIPGIRKCSGSESVLARLHEVVQLFRDTYRSQPLDPRVSVSKMAEKLNFSRIEKKRIVTLLKDIPKLWRGMSGTDLELEFEVSPYVLQFGGSDNDWISPEVYAIGDESNLKDKNKARHPEIKIFISHSSADRDIAERLVELFRTSLNLPSDKILCTSVDGYRLPIGADIDEQLRQKVHEAEILIGIITSSSMQSAYVLFELGARWGAERPMFPLLVSSSYVGILGGPLKGLNYLCCDSSSQLHQLVDEIAEKLHSKKEKPASYQKKIDEIVEFSRAQRDTQNENTENRILFEEGVYWRERNGIREGPFCQLCWDRDNKLIRLYHEIVDIDEKNWTSIWSCRACSSNYEIENLDKYT